MGAQANKRASSTTLLTSLRPAITSGNQTGPEGWGEESLCSGLGEEEFL